jgi:hypothetical protein
VASVVTANINLVNANTASLSLYMKMIKLCLMQELPDGNITVHRPERRTLSCYFTSLMGGTPESIEDYIHLLVILPPKICHEVRTSWSNTSE